MDKHLLAYNPMRKESGGVCIIRTVAPIGLFEILYGHVFFDTQKENKAYTFYKHYSYFDEKFTVKLHYYGGFKEPTPTQEEALEMAIKHIDDAWYWYMAYLKKNP